MIESLKRNKGRTDFVACAARVIASRLREDARCYLHYGPYWWPLKEELQKEGSPSVDARTVRSRTPIVRKPPKG